MLTYRSALGHTIRAERTKRKMTMRTVSGNSAVALGYLSEIERGLKEPSSEVVEGIAAALGLPTWSLVSKASQAMKAAA